MMSKAPAPPMASPFLPSVRRSSTLPLSSCPSHFMMDLLDGRRLTRHCTESTGCRSPVGLLVRPGAAERSDGRLAGGRRDPLARDDFTGPARQRLLEPPERGANFAQHVEQL